MSDSPFIKLTGGTGKVRVIDNDTGGRPLIEADQHTGDMDVFRNRGFKPQVESLPKSWWARALTKLCDHILVVITGVFVLIIVAWLGISGTFPWG